METMLSFKDSKKMLDKYNLKMAKSIEFSSEKEAKTAAKKIGFPLVLKALPKDARHKSELSLVKTSIKSEKELSEKFKEVSKKVNENKLEIESIQLQEQLDGIEIIIGSKEDPTFGKTILVGIGGIYAELYKDVSIRILPLKAADVQQMINETRLKEFVKPAGFRNKKINETKLVETILKIAKMVEKENIKELDLNPIIALEDNIAIADVRIRK